VDSLLIAPRRATEPGRDGPAVRFGAMASKRYRETAEVERKFVQQELIAGWIALAAQFLALVAAVALVVTAVEHASEWRVVVGSGSASAVLGTLVFINRTGSR
jgi:hypothetical protein